MKIIAVSDIHFYPFPAFATLTDQGINSRIQHTQNRLKEIFEVADKLDAPILFGGDLFHVKKLEAETIDLAVKTFNLCKQPIIGVPGNHDMGTFGPDGRHSARAISKIEWLDNYGSRMSTIVKQGERVDVYGIPYVRTKEELKKELEKVPKKVDVLLMHCGFAGTEMGSDYIADLGDCADPEWVFGKAKLVVTGHFHIAQVIAKDEQAETYKTQKPTQHGQYTKYKDYETILVPGSPEPHNWGDINSVRGFWIIDTNEKTLTFQKLNSPQFVEVSTQEDLAKAEGNYVRVVSKDIPLKMLQELKDKTAGMTVEMEHELAAKPNRGYEVAASDRPEEIVKKYVDAHETTLDKEVLKKMGVKYLCG